MRGVHAAHPSAAEAPGTPRPPTLPPILPCSLEGAGANAPPCLTGLISSPVQGRVKKLKSDAARGDI